MKKTIIILTIMILFLTPFINSINANTDNDIQIKTISSEKYEKGYRYNTHGWIYLHIEGEPYERGYQHGYLLADEIVDMIGRWKAMFPQKNKWKTLRLDAVRLFWPKYPDEYKQEIKGIADGVMARGSIIDNSPIDYKDILTMNEMYESLSRFRRYSVYPFRIRDSWWMGAIRQLFSNIDLITKETHMGKCSAFLATGDSTKDGGIVVGHTTFGFAKSEGYWWHNYICNRWNVLLDIKPTKGHRMLFSTSPGLIWSDQDFYQNEEGMILMETTLDPLGPWSRFGNPIVIRARKAIQYSDSIDEMLNTFLTKNNGLMANDWLMGDTKTGEIASLELALRHHSITRKKDGYIWSCNNAKDRKVRGELYSFTGLGLLGRILRYKFIPSGRDIKFEELLEKYYGEINVDIAKKILSSEYIVGGSVDCKITSTKLIDNFGLWAFMGKPDGTNFYANEHPFTNPVPRYTDYPACGWIQIFTKSKQLKFRYQGNQINEGEPGIILWEHTSSIGEFGNAIYSSPVKDGDIIYITSWNGNISAIDIKSNDKIWETNVGWSSSSSPTIIEDIVYVGSSEGTYCLDKKSGEIIWKNENGVVTSKPAYANHIVYCGSHDGNIYALNNENGKLEWSFETRNEIYSSPIVDNDVLYIGSNDGYLYAIDVINRDLKWKFKTDGPITSAPCLADNVLYFGSWDGNLYSINSERGTLNWKFSSGWGIDSTPAVSNGNIFVGSEDTNFYSIDSEDGSLNWIFSTNGGIQSSPTVYGGFVFFGSSDGNMYALNETNGKLEWKKAPDYFIEGIHNYKTKPIISSPSVDEGMVYVGSTNGKVYCFDAQTIEISEPDEIDIDIPTDTYLFIIMSLILVSLITAIYLVITRRKNI